MLRTSEKVAEEIPHSASRLIARFWPGPLTVLVPKKPSVPLVVSATSTVGVRVPDHEVARACCVWQDRWQ